MAKIVEEQRNPVIRCCQAVQHRVKGCFTLFELEPGDLKISAPDSDGDTTTSCKCPKCGMTLYPKWQLPNAD